MRRREFIGILGGLALSRPIKAHAQRADRRRRVGLIVALAEDDPETQSRIKAFRLGLRDLDWVEGRNIEIDYRFPAGDPMRIKEQAAELVSLAPDVLWGMAHRSWPHCGKRRPAFQLYFRSSTIQWVKASSPTCLIQEAISLGSHLSISQSLENGLAC